MGFLEIWCTVIDVCPAKNASYPSKNKFDWITWLAPAKKTFGTCCEVHVLWKPSIQKEISEWKLKNF